MSDLIERLNAAIDEEERLAQEAAKAHLFGTWHMGNKWNVYTSEADPDDSELVVWGNTKPTALHIAHHNPAAILRKVEGARKLLELHPVDTRQGWNGQTEYACPCWTDNCGGTPYETGLDCSITTAVALMFGVEP